MKQNLRVIPRTPWTAASLWRCRWPTVAVLILAHCCFGLGEALLVRAQLGATPWVVFAQGLGLQLGLSVGLATFCVSLVVMLGWLPLRLRPGLGTLANMVLIAAVLDLALHWLPAPEPLALRVIFCLGGIGLIGVGSGFYLSCHMGAGPRDGLMVGLCARLGWSIARVRSSLEISVCLLGWLLGGNLGLGTLLFAAGIGPVIQLVLGVFARVFQQPQDL